MRICTIQWIEIVGRDVARQRYKEIGKSYAGIASNEENRHTRLQMRKLKQPSKFFQTVSTRHNLAYRHNV
jgi:hypothetical protein